MEDFTSDMFVPIPHRIDPNPVTPDAIATLCRLSDQMIKTQNHLPELREALIDRFESHEALTRLHLNAIHKQTAQLDPLLAQLVELNSNLKELNSNFNRYFSPGDHK